MQAVLIAGCGRLGMALAAQLATLASPPQVFGLRRRPWPGPGRFVPLAADLLGADLAQRLPQAPLDAVVLCAAAPGRTEADYQRTYVDATLGLAAALATLGQRPARVLFVSSTAVYGQDDGSWVDEDAATQPATFRGRLLLAGERAAQASFGRATSVRLAGLYGDGRRGPGSALASARPAASGAPVAAAPGALRYTNRIHQTDAAGLLAHLLQGPEPAACFIGADDLPAPQHEVAAYRAHLGGFASPPAPPPSAPVRGKRCRNLALHASGYVLRFPTFREGYSTYTSSSN